MLKGRDRKYLRGLAHGLRPVVQVGKGGLTEAVLTAADEALASHELIKVQIFAEREDREVAADSMATELACECVGTIGKMAIFYRQQDDPDKRKVVLPESWSKERLDD